MSNQPRPGKRQQRAAQIRAESEREQGSAPAPEADAAPEVEVDTSVVTDTEPVGQGEYIVKPWECIMSIAHQFGFFWETVWNDPGNAELRAARDPRVLMEGDRVTIPEKGSDQESGETERVHEFELLGERVRLRIRFLKEGQPRANEPYIVEVEGGTFETGSTDEDGLMDIFVSSQARRGTARVGEGEDQTIYELSLGTLDPHKSISGIQQRLKNLGLYDAQVDGIFGTRTKHALRAFQLLHDLTPANGNPNEATREKLKTEHGS